jgi:hypothetical protein
LLLVEQVEAKLLVVAEEGLVEFLRGMLGLLLVLLTLLLLAQVAR